MGSMMTSNSKLEIALALADAGCAVFPLKENGKAPACEHGFLDATRDAAQINAWWTETPEANIGLSTGPSNYTVVDIDPGGEEAWAALRAKHGIPETCVVKTPRGHHHYFVGATPKSTAGKLAEHIDTRSEKGYVVAAGSTIDGVDYIYANDADPVPLPDAIRELLQRNEAEPIAVAPAGVVIDSPANISRATAMLRVENVSVEGSGGNDLAYRIIAQVKDEGLSQAEALDVISSEWNQRCQPPWSPDELDALVAHVYEFGQNEIGARANPPGAVAFEHVVAKDAALDADKPFLYIRGPEDWKASPVAEMQVETILAARSVLMPWGDFDAGKTYFMVELVTAVGMGRPAFGRFKTLLPGTGLIFAGEDPERLEQSRLVAVAQKYCDGDLARLNTFTVQTAIPLDDPNLWEKYYDEVKRFVKKRGPLGCIGNDTLKRSIGSLKQSENETADRFTKVMEGLAKEFSCSVICNAHEPKAGASGYIAGSKDFTNAASVTPHLIRTSEKPFNVKIEFEPKYRIGARPSPILIHGHAQQLPAPVSGQTSDLCFTAVSDAEAQRLSVETGPVAELRGDRETVAAALVRLKWHEFIGGGITPTFAAYLAGDAANYKNRAEYDNAVTTWGKKLLNGTRSRTTKKGKKMRTRYDGYFEIDNRSSPACVRWFIPEGAGGDPEPEIIGPELGPDTFPATEGSA